MSNRATRGILAAIAVGAFTLAAAGCGPASREVSDAVITELVVPSTTTTTVPPPPECDGGEEAAIDGHELESYAPDRSLAPGQLPTGAAMKNILGRPNGGRLIVGVDENTPYFGVRNGDGQLEGLEIDLVREIATAIWPADADHIDDRIQWKTVVTEEKVPYARDGEVDMTVSVVTINCDRWKEVAFSTPYFRTPQRVLVRDDSDIEALDDLDGRKVCVTKGSSTIGKIQETVPTAVPFEVEARTDCLVAFQDGKVDAIATHDTILFGLRTQEGRKTRILPGDLGTWSDYGIAMSCGADDCLERHDGDDVSLVRVVNGVLEQMRADGRLQGLYDTWLTSNGYTTPPVPPATYRDES